MRTDHHSHHEHVHEQENRSEQKDHQNSHGHHSVSDSHNDSNPPHGHEDHDHYAMMIDDFKKRFWISLILTIPILLLSDMIQHWLGFDIKFNGDKYLLLALSTFIFFYGG